MAPPVRAVVAMIPAASHEVSMVAFASAAPIHTPGQMRVPVRSSAASAMPEGGQTAVA